MSETTRKIFIISDLHLGGEAEPGKRGFRICTHETVLAAFIDWLAAMQGAAIELVINGDVVDFLAEKADGKEPWSAFRFPEQKAVDCLDIIVKRSALVFDALKRFLATGHRLVILPGNHDIELNLPAVRRRLREHVGAGRGGDYEFIAHGEAYRVGDVLIEHGNRVDDMNFVDYHSLRHLCGLVSRGMAVRDEFLFDPPAGSKLVAEVINKIKKDYSFIDLLKPEAKAALPVILALEPGRSGELLKIAKALAAAKFRRRQQLRDYNSNISAMEIEPVAVGSEEEISLLGTARSFASLLLGARDETWERRLHELFDALRSFQNADSFDRSIETEAAYYNEARDLAYGPIRHVVFGHTHLAKQVPLPGGGFYFNCGTWADLLMLPRDILDSTRKFAPLAELEHLVRGLCVNDLSRDDMFHPTYVSMGQDDTGHSVAVDLCDFPKELWR
jgi:UDP-2,3-diacylglucosamine pyrophosphatase LpxH